MKAMVLHTLQPLAENAAPLTWQEVPDPKIKKGELLIKITACGVCHTELDEIEARTSPTFLPIIPGHQIVGKVVQTTEKARFKVGDKVGIGWIYHACGKCDFCKSGYENLCPEFKATGRDVNGGYAEYISVPENFANRIPDGLKDEHVAPLLCAGAIGYRSLNLSGIQNGQSLGLAGFGASGHLVLKIVRSLFPDVRVFVFTRSPEERNFAKELGAEWSGYYKNYSPLKLNSIIDTTPAWMPVVEAFKNLRPGGRLIINAIRKENNDRSYLKNLNYSKHLWMEKEVKSVANITRKDIGEFLQLAKQMNIQPAITLYALKEANKALVDLKNGTKRGAKVLLMP